jgi:bifunctional UDP-N-acetylglucosamine pyrophosphorylase/glucosamine-1-phosphate N-acetyltransferase
VRCESKADRGRRLNPSKRSLEERGDIRGCGLPPHIAARMCPGASLGDGEARAIRRDQGRDVRGGRQGQPSLLRRRRPCRRQRQSRPGTITCNYDGFFKHKTTIGEGAFVGTNSSLVAPVKIGNGAYIGSGSVITKDVPDDAMAVERSPQSNREGRAARYREMKMRAKKPKEG